MPRAHEVFGVSKEVLPLSYVDRGDLDTRLSKLLHRNRVHVALRGASKCGKSWLRAKVIENPIIVQCRLGRTTHDLYTDALSQLDLELTVEKGSKSAFKGTIKAAGQLGAKLLGAIGIDVSAEAGYEKTGKTIPVGKDINDLRFVADIIKASGRKLVIEDFHYLAIDERKTFSFDIKSFWDWGLNIVIIGVWSQDNMLLSLNPDLAGRIEEISIHWGEADLGCILDKGGSALNVRFIAPMRKKLIDISFGNAGILQWLALACLDEEHIEDVANPGVDFADPRLVDSVAMAYADQLNPLYQEFAKSVSDGIRTRRNSTGIYAHAMAAIIEASDEKLIDGLSADDIFATASARQPRIQLGNLKSILARLDSLQVDDAGRNLILTYNPATERVSVVDRQLLLYRKFSTIKWPWEQLIAEAGEHVENDA